MSVAHLSDCPPAAAGTLLDKSERVMQLVEVLAPATGLQAHVGTAREAARLGKADLGSAMVTELTALAGTMGRIYAQHSGEPASMPRAQEYARAMPTSAQGNPLFSAQGGLCGACLHDHPSKG